MKKILLNYLKPQVRVYQVNTENLLQITSPNSIPDNDDYDNGRRENKEADRRFILIVFIIAVLYDSDFVSKIEKVYSASRERRICFFSPI